MSGGADASLSGGQHDTESGELLDLSKMVLPPIGQRSRRGAEAAVAPPEVDKFSKAMDRVLMERSSPGAAQESASNHIIARGENQMMGKHGIAKVGQGVVDKFNAARHNTAIMSAMGHPGLNKLVAKEEEEKRKRRARMKELKQQQLAMSMNGRQGALKDGGGVRGGGDPAEGELPNVYAALGQAVPLSRGQSMMVPPAQAQAQALALQAALAAQGLGGGGSGASTGRGRRGGQSLPLARQSAPSSIGGGLGGMRSGPSEPSSPNRRQPRWRRRVHGKDVSSEPVVRATSRVGKVLGEFQGQVDWCSVTVMKHSLATILQANVRGWLVRRRWHANPEALVDATKAALQAERLTAERRAAMKAELERRAMTRKQKDKASSVINMLFSQKSTAGKGLLSSVGGPGGGGGGGSAPSLVGTGGVSMGRMKWNRLNKNVDLAKEQLEAESYGEAALSDSDSDQSDMGAEDVALVKMRARTPPWQKVEQSQWEGQWAKLNQRTDRGNLDVLWDLAESANRVQAVRQRRAERAGGHEPGSPAASGAMAAAEAEATKPYDPATEPLPSDVVTELLVHRYIDKYRRLGLLDHLPLRGAAEAALQKQEQQAREAAVREVEDRRAAAVRAAAAEREAAAAAHAAANAAAAAATEAEAS